jgi:hypothetical protein
LCLAIWLLATADSAWGQANPYAALPTASTNPYPTTVGEPVVTQWPTQFAPPPMAAVPVNPNAAPTSASWIVPGDPAAAACDPNIGYVDANVYCGDAPFPGEGYMAGVDDPWTWQPLPLGIIYRSYWAGVHEPRMGIQLIRMTNTGESFWDPTVGARVGLLRYGNTDALHPQGWQLDVEGAALPRLTLDNVRDLEAVDFRGGVPLTYGVDNWQFKLAYYHLSSHLGDEYAINHPGSLDERINYVRDSAVFGASYYAVPELRLYAEAGYAINATGGAEPWEFQFGTEWSKAGPTDARGTPFLALNGYLREELNFGGDFTAEAGWLWRNQIGQTLRLGAFYFNGKSSQFQTFDKFEEQIGAGLWYDF